MPPIYLAARSPAVGDSFISLGSLVALRILSTSGESPWRISYGCRVFYQIKWRHWCKVVVLNPPDATLSVTASFMLGMVLTAHRTGHHHSHLLDSGREVANYYRRKFRKRFGSSPPCCLHMFHLKGVSAFL